jgi:hypothetical protein
LKRETQGEGNKKERGKERDRTRKERNIKKYKRGKKRQECSKKERRIRTTEWKRGNRKGKGKANRGKE